MCRGGVRFRAAIAPIGTRASAFGKIFLPADRPTWRRFSDAGGRGGSGWVVSRRPKTAHARTSGSASRWFMEISPIGPVAILADGDAKAPGWRLDAGCRRAVGSAVGRGRRSRHGVRLRAERPRTCWRQDGRVPTIAVMARCCPDIGIDGGRSWRGTSGRPFPKGRCPRPCPSQARQDQEAPHDPAAARAGLRRRRRRLLRLGRP